MSVHSDPFPDDVRRFVETAPWTFARTYAATWPHEYVVQNAENAPMILALARHIFERGTGGRFYSHIRKYHHEDGKVYWSMDPTPEATTRINRCNEAQTYEARLVGGTLPNR
jgi:hypothetical protein